MYVKKLVKTEEGSFLFEGEITQEEHEALIALGLMVAVEEGLIQVQEKPSLN